MKVLKKDHAKMGKRYIEDIAFGINICKLLVVYWCGGTKTSGILMNLTKLQSSHLDMLARGLLQYNKRFWNSVKMTVIIKRCCQDYC